jgi:hypothetical protein
MNITNQVHEKKLIKWVYFSYWVSVPDQTQIIKVTSWFDQLSRNGPMDPDPCIGRRRKKTGWDCTGTTQQYHNTEILQTDLYAVQKSVVMDTMTWLSVTNNYYAFFALCSWNKGLICLSASPHDSTREPLDEFWLNLVWTLCQQRLTQTRNF